MSRYFEDVLVDDGSQARKFHGLLSILLDEILTYEECFEICCRCADFDHPVGLPPEDMHRAFSSAGTQLADLLAAAARRDGEPGYTTVSAGPSGNYNHETQKLVRDARNRAHSSSGVHGDREVLYTSLFQICFFRAHCCVVIDRSGLWSNPIFSEFEQARESFISQCERWVEFGWPNRTKGLAEDIRTVKTLADLAEEAGGAAADIPASATELWFHQMRAPVSSFFTAFRRCCVLASRGYELTERFLGPSE